MTEIIYLTPFIDLCLGVGLLGAIFLVIGFIGRRKSLSYRKYLSDMFVASKLRKLADKDNLDLVEEAKSFGNWAKKNKLKELQSVDTKILEQVNAEVDNAIEAEESKESKPKAK